MKKRTIQQAFVEFLVEEGVFKAYRRNWDKRFGEKPIKRRENYINAFVWANAPEPPAFWYHLCEKWLKHLKKLKETSPGYYHTKCNDCGRFVKMARWILKTQPEENVRCQYCSDIKAEWDW